MSSAQADESFEELKKLFEKNVIDSGAHPNENSDAWLARIRDRLYCMFRTPLKEEYYQEAFKWVANLCLSAGDFSWLCTNNEWSEDGAKVFACIALLSLNEFHILLPLIQRHLTCGEQLDKEGDKIIRRPANPAEYAAFGDHLVILESTIKSLVKNQCEDDEYGGNNDLTHLMKVHELRNLLDRLRSVIGDICGYLEVVHRYWAKLIDDTSTDIFVAAEGALRIIAVWISEEPTSFESQCKRFLNDLFLKNLLLIGRPTNHDLVILALHSACTSNDELLAALRANSDHRDALQRYLDRAQAQRGPARKEEKTFKLRCGLVKDLLSK